MGETRTAAMRAIILYPMNALVEDQLSRLRKALDSDVIRDLYNNPEVESRETDFLEDTIARPPIQKK